MSLTHLRDVTRSLSPGSTGQISSPRNQFPFHKFSNHQNWNGKLTSQKKTWNCTCTQLATRWQVSWRKIYFELQAIRLQRKKTQNRKWAGCARTLQMMAPRRNGGQTRLFRPLAPKIIREVISGGSSNAVAPRPSQCWWWYLERRVA